MSINFFYIRVLKILFLYNISMRRQLKGIKLIIKKIKFCSKTLGNVVPIIFTQLLNDELTFFVKKIKFDYIGNNKFKYIC